MIKTFLKHSLFEYALSVLTNAIEHQFGKIKIEFGEKYKTFTYINEDGKYATLMTVFVVAKTFHTVTVKYIYEYVIDAEGNTHFIDFPLARSGGEMRVQLRTKTINHKSIIGYTTYSYDDLH